MIQPRKTIQLTNYVTTRNKWLRMLHRNEQKLASYETRIPSNQRTKHGHRTAQIYKNRIRFFEDLIDNMDKLFGITSDDAFTIVTTARYTLTLDDYLIYRTQRVRHMFRVQQKVEQVGHTQEGQRFVDRLHSVQEEIDEYDALFDVESDELLHITNIAKTPATTGTPNN